MGRTAREVIDLMLRLNTEHGLTFVSVTHAAEVAARAGEGLPCATGVFTATVRCQRLGGR